MQAPRTPHRSSAAWETFCLEVVGKYEDELCVPRNIMEREKNKNSILLLYVFRHTKQQRVTDL